MHINFLHLSSLMLWHHGYGRPAGLKLYPVTCLCVEITAKVVNNPHTGKNYTSEKGEKRQAHSIGFLRVENRFVEPRTANVRQREVAEEGGRGWSFIIFVSPGRKGRWAGREGLSYKLSVGGINVALLVKAGRGEPARSMLVGVPVCSHCLSTVISGC